MNITTASESDSVGYYYQNTGGDYHQWIQNSDAHTPYINIEDDTIQKLHDHILQLDGKIHNNKQHINFLYEILYKLMNEIIVKEIDISNVLKHQILTLLEKIDNMEEKKIDEDDDFIKSKEMTI